MILTTIFRCHVQSFVYLPVFLNCQCYKKNYAKFELLLCVGLMIGVKQKKLNHIYVFTWKDNIFMEKCNLMDIKPYKIYKKENGTDVYEHNFLFKIS